MLTHLPDPNNKKGTLISKCVKREVWNLHRRRTWNTCMILLFLSQVIFEVGNKSMGTMNMLEFIKAQNLSGLKNFVKQMRIIITISIIDFYKQHVMNVFVFYCVFCTSIKTVIIQSQYYYQLLFILLYCYCCPFYVNFVSIVW